MQTSPQPQAPLQSFADTGQRMAYLAAFALETWSRLLVPGAHAARAQAEQARWVAENMCALHGLRPALRGDLQLPEGPCVVVANHITYFDPLVLGSLLPLSAIAKREVLDWPLIGALSRKLGTLYVTREDAHSGARCLREARRMLARGVSVLVFPEGTTTRGREVLPFKRGMFGVSAQVGVPVVPVCLQYERAEAAWIGEDAFLPHYMKSMRYRCTRVEVEVLPAFRVQSVSDAAEAAEAARSAVSAALRSRVRVAQDRNVQSLSRHAESSFAAA